MECPYCKKEIPKGGLPMTDEFYWYNEEDPMVAAVMLAKRNFTMPDLTAYYCEKCKMIFLPVPEKVEGTMDKLKKKWSDFSEKREAAAEARQARAEEEKREKEREKRAKKDPWER